MKRMTQGRPRRVRLAFDKCPCVCKTIVAAAMLFSLGLSVLSQAQARNSGSASAQEQPANQSFKQFLEKSVVQRSEIDRFLTGTTWAKFDPELGYMLANSMMPWGIDHTFTIETVQANGARTSFLYPNRKARINAYGDSWTECEQVNDGETWEEYLAGHLGEPVGNFGVGGYGVYQAYRRMLREEKTDHGAHYLIFTICCDDGIRSLYRVHWAAVYPWLREYAESMHLFDGNYWDHLEMDLETGHFVEKRNLLSTEQSLYHMTEPEWMAEHLKDDLALELEAYRRGYIRELDREKITKLAVALDFPFDWSLESKPGTVMSRWSDTPETLMQFQAGELLNRYGEHATILLLDKARAFAAENGKKLLVVLDGTVDLDRMKTFGVREDQGVLDYLVKERVDYVDLNQVFFSAFQKSNLSAAEYMKPYLVNGEGHPNPMTNHSIAYALKDKVVEWLDPKPVPYQPLGTQSENLKRYVHGPAND